MKEILGYLTQDGKAYQALFQVRVLNGMFIIGNTLADTTFSIPVEKLEGIDDERTEFKE